MTLSPWIIYLYGQADVLRIAVFTLGLFSLFWSIIGIMVMSDVKPVVTTWHSDADKQKEVEAKADDICAIKKSAMNRRVRKWFAISVALGVFGVVLPSSKTVALIVVIPAIINSEPIQKDLPEIYQMAKDALKQTLTTK